MATRLCAPTWSMELPMTSSSGSRCVVVRCWPTGCGRHLNTGSPLSARFTCGARIHVRNLPDMQKTVRNASSRCDICEPQADLQDAAINLLAVQLRVQLWRQVPRLQQLLKSKRISADDDCFGLQPPSVCKCDAFRHAPRHLYVCHRSATRQLQIVSFRQPRTISKEQDSFKERSTAAGRLSHLPVSILAPARKAALARA
jgi:hypothetical protein